MYWGGAFSAFNFANEHYVLYDVLDLNADGFRDIVTENEVFFGGPSGFSNLTSWPGQSFPETGGIGLEGYGRNMIHADVNGDGLPDRLRLNGATTLYAEKVGPPGGLLVEVNNGLGARWSVGYASSSSYLNDPDVGCNGCDSMPFSVWTVSRVEIESQYGSSFTGYRTDSYATDYKFGSGIFDRAELEFLGFMKSTELRAADSKQTYRKFSHPIGANVSDAPPKLELLEVRSASGEILERSEELWQGVYVGMGRFQVRRTSMETTVCEASEACENPGSGAGQHQYVGFANFNSNNLPQRMTIDATGVPNAVQRDTTFDTNCPLSPVSNVVTEAGTVLQRTDHTYDTNCNLRTRSALLNVDDPSPTKVREWIYDPAVDPAANAGMPTKVWDAKNLDLQAHGSPAAQPTRLRYNCGTVSNHALYACEITNPDSHVTSREYDLSVGLRISETSANNDISSWTYDGLGRPLTLVAPGVAAPVVKYDYYNGSSYVPPELGGSPAIPSRIVRSLIEPANADSSHPGYRQEATFVDGLGRELETKRDNVVADTDTRTVSDAVIFDTVGRVAKRLVAFAGFLDSSVYDTPSLPSPGESFQYDAHDRVEMHTHPDGTYVKYLYYEGNTQVTLDENYNEMQRLQ